MEGNNVNSGTSRNTKPMLRQNYRYIITILTPILLLPIPILIPDSIGCTAFTLLLMSIYWCTECIPVPATALLPMVLFPVLGVLPAQVVFAQYMKDVTVLYFSGLMISIAIEKWDLHKRIALTVLSLFGTKTRWLMLGFLSITAFFSMWMSNIATTAIMLPIAHGVVLELKGGQDDEEDNDSCTGNDSGTPEATRKRSSTQRPTNSIYYVEPKLIDSDRLKPGDSDAPQPVRKRSSTRTTNPINNNAPKPGDSDVSNSIRKRSNTQISNLINNNTSKLIDSEVPNPIRKRSNTKIPLNLINNNTSKTIDSDVPNPIRKRSYTKMPNPSQIDSDLSNPIRKRSNTKVPNPLQIGSDLSMPIRKRSYTQLPMPIYNDASMPNSSDASKPIDSGAPELTDFGISVIITPENGTGPSSNKTSDQHQIEEDPRDGLNQIAKALILCIPFASSIGGTATLIGSTPNLIMLGQIESFFGSGTGVNFGPFMLFAFPVMVLCLFFTWTFLQFYYVHGLCVRKIMKSTTAQQSERVAKYIKQAYSDLGPWSYAQKLVLVNVFMVVLLWLTRDLKLMAGWAAVFKPGYVSSATAGMFVALLLFVIPSQPPQFLCRLGRQNDEETILEEPKPVPALLDWDIIKKKMAWNVLFLLGGGLSLAEACKESGLTSWMGDGLLMLENFSPALITFLVSLIVAGFTQINSNTSTASIFLPILPALAQRIGVNPLYLMLSASLSSSFAFMSPVGSPTNAIAFAYGHVSFFDMAKVGVVITIGCILILNLCINTIGIWVFDVQTFPDWASNAVMNSTGILESV